MDIIPILIFVVVIVAVILIFKFISNLAKALLFAFLLIFIIFLVAGILVYFDVRDIKEKLPTSQKTIILVGENNVLAGMKFLSFDMTQQEPSYLQDAKLKEYTGFYRLKDYGRMQEDSYKLIIVDIKLFEKNNYTIKLENGIIRLDSKKVIEMLKSGDFETYNSLIEKNDQYTKAKIKSSLFMALFSEASKQEGLIFVAKGLKSKEIFIYPETITFKIIKYIPVSLIEKISSKLVTKEQ